MNIAFWKRQARTWHWMSGAICLLGVLLFSLTGITLNHAHQIPAQPVVTESVALLPAELGEMLAPGFDGQAGFEIPAAVSRWLVRELDADIGGTTPEWTDMDLYIALPRPGGDAWLSIDRHGGEVVYEQTSRGAIAWLNDLHKGRNTGGAWSWFIDIFAVACILFCLTGLWLLQMQARRRRSTWPLTIAGVVIPMLLALFFIH